jgi:hypothetical protein
VCVFVCVCVCVLCENSSHDPHDGLWLRKCLDVVQVTAYPLL